MKHIAILLAILFLILTNELVVAQGYPVYCGVGFDLNPLPPDKSSSNLLKFKNNVEDDSCELLFFRAANIAQFEYRKGYDSLRYAIETCPNYSLSSSYFNHISGAVSNMSNDTGRFIDYREWLKKVLYLNTQNWRYYCADVRSIMFTMNYFPGRGNDYNGSIAILKYVIESGKCPKEYFAFSDTTMTLWGNTRKHQYQNWHDSVRDSIATPFDTTLPSLESLNLQILFGLDHAVQEHEAVDLSAIRLFEASPNPFHTTAELHYHLGSTAGLKLQIYDALGKEVYNDPIGFRSAGDYTIKLNTSSWSSGSYFARLSSLAGGVVSIKLIRE